MNRYLSGFILLSALLLPSTAHADIGFPMIIIWYPVMAFALVPIIAVETWVLYVSIDISIWEAVKIMAITNLLTTLIGTPIAWLLSGALTPKWISVFHYAGDPPTPSWYKEGKFPWQAYVGHLYAIFIFFLASWYAEYLIISGWFLSDIDQSIINDIACNANAISYSLLAIGVIVLAIVDWKKKWSWEKDDSSGT